MRDEMMVFKKRNKFSIAISLTLLLVFGAVQAYAVVSGQQLWAKRYSTTSNDSAASIAIDKNNNVYVAGTSNNDYVVIKYDSSGVQKWKRTYNGPGKGDDNATAIAVDSNGNVYVTGGSLGDGTEFDYATIKYDSSGNQKWARRYSSSSSGSQWDEANAIAIDKNNNVYVTGSSGGGYAPTRNDICTIKYDTNGNKKWIKRFNGSANKNDDVYAIAVDSSGNTFVAGATQNSDFTTDYVVIKYDSAGTQKWVRKYDGQANMAYSSYDEANAIAVDKNGNVYVTGESNNISSMEEAADYATVKYDSSGSRKWVRRYNGPANYFDRAAAISIDKNNNVYVTGISYTSGGYPGSFATLKYDSAGNRKWVRSYNSDESAEAYDMAIDSNDNVYVTGKGTNSNYGYTFDYNTVKYDSAGNRKWVKRYNGSGNANDGANAIVIDSNNNVYVTGYSAGSTTKTDIATIKYAP